MQQSVIEYRYNSNDISGLRVAIPEGGARRVKITICIGSSCHLKGSRQVVERLKERIAEHGLKNEIVLCGSFCMGRCQAGVSVMLDTEAYSVSPENVDLFFLETVLPKLATQPGQPGVFQDKEEKSHAGSYEAERSQANGTTERVLI